MASHVKEIPLFVHCLWLYVRVTGFMRCWGRFDCFVLQICWRILPLSLKLLPRPTAVLFMLSVVKLLDVLEPNLKMGLRVFIRYCIDVPAVIS